MAEFLVKASDFGFEVTSAIVQLACFLVIGRQIAQRPSWRARLHWAAYVTLVYFATLLAFSRLAVAPVLAALMMRMLMMFRDQLSVLRQAAVLYSSQFNPPRHLLIKRLRDWVHKPVLDPITVILGTLLVIFAIWEPRDNVLDSQIMEIILLPARYVSAWWLMADILVALVMILLAEIETSIQNFCYAAACAALVFCALLALSSRPAFSAVTVFLLIVGIVHLSTLKFRRTTTNLHAYDFIYLSRNHSDVEFWLKNERADALLLLLKISSGVILLSIIGLIEPSGIDRRLVALLSLLGLIAFGVAGRFRIRLLHWGLHPEPLPFSLFIETISEAYHAHKSGGVLKTEAAPRLLEFANVMVPKPESSRPTIILIMNESTFPPWLYRPESNDAIFANFFRSTDAQAHGLRVEIFGGPTWMTEFSVLTGIPSSCYGSFGAHVFYWATNQIHHSLPHYLKNYGYRTGLILPSLRELAGGDRFYPSIGFDDIRDRRMIGTMSYREPDAFYLNCALDWLSDHFSQGEGPAFLYVLTMSNHYPHDVQLMEEEGSLRSKVLADGEFNEYLRRLRRSCRDYSDFRAQLARRFPDREFLIVHFGDHQPPFTARLRGGTAPRVVPQDPWLDLIKSGEIFPREELAYMTYFAIDGVNFKPEIGLDLPATIEPAYLSTLTLMAARIPLDGLHTFRYKLMKRHGGRLYFADENGKLAAQLNHNMIECGLVSKH
jgi:hypothetical protein